MQLSIRLRFDPQFDRLVTLANLDQPEIPFMSESFGRRRGGTESSQWEPGSWLVRAVQETPQARSERQLPPDHPKLDGDSQIGETGRHNAARSRRICRQDQTLHGHSLTAHAKQNGR